MAYKYFFQTSDTRPPRQKGASSLADAITLNFSLSTLLLTGACLQTLAALVTKSHLSVLVTPTLLLFVKLTITLLQSYGPLPNPYMKDVIPGRVTALAPNSDGQPSAPSRKIAVLHLGVKSNHPMGIFQPQLGRMNTWLEKMNVEFDKGMHTGFLGQTMFTRKDERGAFEAINISYWDGVDALWEFAHSGTHRDAWQWWERTLKDNNAIGINHEIYEAEAGAWENIYINFQPTLQGATTYLKKGGKLEGGVVADQWVSPIVDARRGKLAKSSGRFGRDDSVFDENRVAKEKYDA